MSNPNAKRSTRWLPKTDISDSQTQLLILKISQTNKRTYHVRNYIHTVDLILNWIHDSSNERAPDGYQQHSDRIVHLPLHPIKISGDIRSSNHQMHSFHTLMRLNHISINKDTELINLNENPITGVPTDTILSQSISSNRIQSPTLYSSSADFKTSLN